MKLQRGIGPWARAIGASAFQGLQYRSDSGYGLFCGKGASTSVIGLIDGERVLGQATLNDDDVKAIQTLFAGNVQQSPELHAFREKRPLGEFAGFEVRMHGDITVTSVRVYKNRFFDAQTLLAFVVNAEEICAVAFDDNELPSISQIIKGL